VRVIGIIATVVVIGFVGVGIGIGVMSIPDIKRYLAMRRM
jgi:hypothetical protein